MANKDIIRSPIASERKAPARRRQPARPDAVRFLNNSWRKCLSLVAWRAAISGKGERQLSLDAS